MGADGTESDTTYQNLIRISAFHSEAPRATAPAVPGAAKLTVPPAGMGAALVRRDSIGFEVRFYFRAHICTDMSRFVHLLQHTARNAGPADRDGPVMPAARGSASRKLRLATRFPTMCGASSGDDASASSSRPRGPPRWRRSRGGRCGSREEPLNPLPSLPALTASPRMAHACSSCPDPHVQRCEPRLLARATSSPHAPAVTLV